MKLEDKEAHAYNLHIVHINVVNVTGKEGSGADEARGKGSSAQRLRVSEAGKASVDGSTAGQLTEEGRQNCAVEVVPSADVSDPNSAD